VTGLGVLVVGLNASTLNVALPTVVRHFHAGPLAASWILLSYMLANTVLILFFGRLADILGRERLYLSGFLILTCASFLLGFSPNVVVLILLRVVQAVGAALIVTNTTAIITDVFPPRLLGQGLGLNVALVSIAQMLGPPVGGFFATSLGWRWVFWFNVPVGAIGLIWAARVLRRQPRTGAREPIDVLGAVIMALALAGLLYGVSEGGVQGWGSPPVIAGLAVAAALIPVFLLVEHRTRYPMVDLGLFRNREFALANLANFLNSVARSAPLLIVALFLQAVHGDRPLEAGLKVLPISIGLLVASPVAGFLSKWHPARILSTLGLLCSTVGLIVIAMSATPDAPYLPMAVGLALTGFGFGFFLTPNTTSIMSAVARQRRGIANGVRSMLQNTGFVVSTALALAISTSSLLPDAKSQAYAGTLSHLSTASVGTFAAGCRTAMLVMAAATAAAIVASFSRGATLSRMGEPEETSDEAQAAP
jgi:EmrB/QacA subfamily drug resistance transporter